VVSAQAQRVRVADNADVGVNAASFTLAAWLYLDSKPANAHALGKWGAAGTAQDYRIAYVGATDRIRLNLYTGSVQLNLDADAFGSPPLTTWFFVVAGWDSVAGKAYIQVNDGTVNEAVHAGGCQRTSEPFAIGARSAGTVPWNGRIDEAGLWNARWLSNAERTALNNAGAGKTYPFS